MSQIQLSRLIFISVQCAGGKLLRADLQKAFQLCNWRPTIGEVSDAIQYLVKLGKVTRLAGASGYYDFSDCTIVSAV